MINCLLAGSTGVIGSEIKNINNINFIYINRKEIDLTNFNKSEKYVKNLPKINVLIFLVGLAHKKGKKNDYNDHKSLNYSTLYNLVSIMEKQNCLPDKIIFASSISVYGENNNIQVYDESVNLNPISPYAKTKKMSEDYLINNYNYTSWILRLAPVYKSNFLLNILRRTKILSFNYKIGNGSYKLSLCNIENINKTIEKIIFGNVPSGIYNISDADEYSYNDLLKWRKSKFIITIPKFIISIFYFFGKVFNNNYLIENSIKLLTNNIYPSNKIRKFVEFNSTLESIIIDD